MSAEAVWPLGVFTSLDAGLGVRMDVVRELGLPTVQLHAPHAGHRGPEAAKRFAAETEEAGVRVTCLFGGFTGESYASIPETAATVGLVPRDLRAGRAAELHEISDFAAGLNCPALGLHVGFVPHDRGGEDYRDLVRVLGEVCDHAAGHGQTVHLETGQETADHLLDFLGDVSKENLGVNFDPANMILYGTGEPLAALRKVADFVRSVHCKDAVWAAEPDRGREWGREVPLGEGDVDIPGYLRTLHEIGYRGALTIEREIPEDRDAQKADIGKGVALLERVRGEVLGA